MSDMARTFWRWLWKKHPWHRDDRGKFAVFMDFYCERLYPALWTVAFVAFIVASVWACK